MCALVCECPVCVPFLLPGPAGEERFVCVDLFGCCSCVIQDPFIPKLAELQKPKARLVRLETSPELWTLMDLVFVLVLAGGLNYVLSFTS